MCLLTACEHGHGKRTPFGPGITDTAESETENVEVSANDDQDQATETTNTEASETEAPQAYKGNMRYRRQRRGGKGLRDIKTSDRNGQVVDILAVADDDDVLLISTGGKIQRIRAADISQVGRNTQGVRIMRLSDGDNLAARARIPADLGDDDETEEAAEVAEITGTSESVEKTDSPTEPASENENKSGESEN